MGNILINFFRNNCLKNRITIMNVNKSVLGKSLVNNIYKTKVPVELSYYNYNKKYFISLPDNKVKLLNPNVGDYSIEIPPGLTFIIVNAKVKDNKWLFIDAITFGELYLDGKKTITDTIPIENNKYGKYVTVLAEESDNVNFKQLLCNDKIVFSMKNLDVQISVCDFFDKNIGQLHLQKPLNHLENVIELIKN